MKTQKNEDKKRYVGSLSAVLLVMVLSVFVAAASKPSCGGKPKAVIAEVGDSCALSQVECGGGSQCVSQYDGGQMVCKTTCQYDTDCPGAQVCDPAPQISDSAAASAQMICQDVCSSLPGSGCGGEIGAPNVIVKWEVAEVNGHYNMRGINAEGEAYLDAAVQWYGDDQVNVIFESPYVCAVSMSIAEATVYSNTCGEEAAAAIGSVGLDLFTDMETVLADAKKDGSGNWVSKGCPWVVGGIAAISAGYFSAGALFGASFAAAAGTGMIGGAVVGGAVIAIPAVAVLGVTAGGCWLNGKLQDPPLSKCIMDCSFGNTPCFDVCIYNELVEGDLAMGVLLPQCAFACQQGDDNCLNSCSYLMD